MFFQEPCSDLHHPLPDPVCPDHLVQLQPVHTGPHGGEVHLGVLAIPMLQVINF